MSGLWPFLTYGQISIDSVSSVADTAEAKRRAGEADRDVKGLAAELDRTQLACAAMWSFLQEKFGLSDEDLIARINEIDLTDGKLDGKVQKGAVSCPKCGRTISRRQHKCLYCGQAIVHDPFA